jgi:hypothetical protein
MNDNPLMQYFRQPAIYIRLPSQGRFYPEDAIRITPNGEYPVLPMTTIDEITYRTPDALFNGEAVISVIQSCVPNIIDAWSMPAMDIDTVLIAIRIATYGHAMEINTKCPSCEHENDFDLDLRQVLSQIKPGDYEQSVTDGDIEVFFRPMDYRQINHNNLLQFEDQKLLMSVENSDVPVENKMSQLGEILKKITAVTIRSLSQSISAVKTPQATVTDPAHITEWLENCDRRVFALLRDHIIAAKQASEIKPLTITCSACGHQHEQMFTLDMTSFFGDAS